MPWSERLIQRLMNAFLTDFLAAQRSRLVHNLGSLAIKIFHCFETLVQFLNGLVGDFWRVTADLVDRLHYLIETETSQDHLDELDGKLRERICGCCRSGGS